MNTTRTPTESAPKRVASVLSAVGQKRASRRARLRDRRTALAKSEEARLLAEMRYLRMAS